MQILFNSIQTHLMFDQDLVFGKWKLKVATNVDHKNTNRHNNLQSTHNTQNLSIPLAKLQL